MVMLYLRAHEPDVGMSCAGYVGDEDGDEGDEDKGQCHGW
jgi:hypothetical protein